MADEFLRTRAIQTRSGIVMGINYTEVPPPDPGCLRCMYCGSQKLFTAAPYDSQMSHPDCPTGMSNIQSFMGEGWKGWKGWKQGGDS